MTSHNEDFYDNFVKQYYLLTKSLEHVPILLEMIEDERFSAQEARIFFLHMFVIIDNSNVDDALLVKALEDMATKIIAFPNIDLISMNIKGTSNAGQIVCGNNHTHNMMIGLHKLYEYYFSVAKINFKHLRSYVVRHQKREYERKHQYHGVSTNHSFVVKPMSLMEIIFKNYDDSDKVNKYTPLMVSYNRCLAMIAKLSFEACSDDMPGSRRQLCDDLNKCKISNELKTELIAHYCDNFPSFLLALEITTADDFFKIIEAEKKSNVGRFFKICKALPYELQCKIAYSSILVDRSHISWEKLAKPIISVLSS